MTQTTCFLKNGDNYSPADKDQLHIYDKLPIGTYTMVFPMMSAPYFHQIESIHVDFKLYGDTEQKAKRILNTYEQRSASTGVLLVGEKGSGKTLLAKVLSVMGAVADMPTILITEQLHGDAFNQMIQRLDQDAIIIFDEFDKVYTDDEAQQDILTLLDGVYQTKKLFVFTANDQYKVNEFMKNRPGRMYYRLDYTGLSNDFITEYCQDRLNDKSQITGVCVAASLFAEFNFDILSAMVEEMNRYNESAQDTLKMLNARPLADRTQYDVKSLRINGIKKIPLEWVYDRGISQSPLVSSPIQIRFCKSAEEMEDNNYTTTATFSVNDLVSINAKDGSMTFTNKDEDTVVFAKQIDDAFQYTTHSALNPDR